MSTCRYGLIGRSPRTLTGVSARGLENWRSTPGQPGGARKKASIPPKKPLPRPPPFHRRHNRQEPRPVSVASWNVHHILDELNLGHFHPHDHRDVHNLVELRHGHLSLHTRACQRPCPERDNCNCGSLAVFSTPALGSWTGTTGTSITLSVYCNCRISMVF